MSVLMLHKMNKKYLQKHKGFTLIEMMVSVSIFAIVMLISMGAILTIIDANRKSRTLTSVMNNISFAFDSITRTVKSGTDPVIYNSGDGISVCAIKPDLEVNEFDRVRIHYRLNLNNNAIERCVTSSCSIPCTEAQFFPLTAPEVTVRDLGFKIMANGVDVANGASVLPGNQPRVLITIDGEAKLNKIISEFSMQTTVEQRRPNLP